MNEMVNTFLLAEDKFIPEMSWKQPAALSKPGITYCAFGKFTNNKVAKWVKRL